MKRYRKANEGVHAPEELKKQAAQTGRPHRARWMGAVAAVLAVALIGGVAAWSGRAIQPTAQGGDDPATDRFAPEDGPGNNPNPVAHAFALAEAKYPEMAPYPKEDQFVGEDGRIDYDAYHMALGAWRASVPSLRANTAYDGLTDRFLPASAVQLLSGTEGKNRVYSPLNVYMALSMLAETAGGDSRRQILDLLGADSIESLRAHAADLWRDNYRDDGLVTSILANSLWLRGDMTYSRSTLNTLAERYYASSFAGEMGSEEYDAALRDWLNEQTGGLLAEQAAGLKLNPDTVLALASAVYFKAAWSGEFYEGNTSPDVFHAPSGDVETDFMRKTMELSPYYWGERFTAVSLSFEQGGDMWLILPDEGVSVDELLQSGEAMEFLLCDKYGLDENSLEQGGIAGSKSLDIHLSMPKFDVSSDLDLIEGLKELGVTDVFDPNVSDFGPLDAGTPDPLFVSTAQHAARVKVDEEGCEAAAYTVIMTEPGCAPLEDADEVDFVLDRPFLFAITGSSDLPLFLGVVNQPNG